MAHSRILEDDDPYLAWVRELAAALPGAAEKVSHGRPAFFTKKAFDALCEPGSAGPTPDAWARDDDASRRRHRTDAARVARSSRAPHRSSGTE